MSEDEKIQHEANKEIEILETIYADFKKICNKDVFNKILAEAAVLNLFKKSEKELNYILTTISSKSKIDITTERLTASIDNRAPEVFKKAMKLYPVIKDCKIYVDAMQKTGLNEKDFFIQLTILNKAMNFIKNDIIRALENSLAQDGVMDGMFGDVANPEITTTTNKGSLSFLNKESVRVLNLNSITCFEALIDAGYRKVEILLTSKEEFQKCITKIEALGSMDYFINRG